MDVSSPTQAKGKSSVRKSPSIAMYYTASLRLQDSSAVTAAQIIEQLGAFPAKEPTTVKISRESIVLKRNADPHHRIYSSAIAWVQGNTDRTTLEMLGVEAPDAEDRMAVLLVHLNPFSGRYIAEVLWGTIAVGTELLDHLRKIMPRANAEST